MQRYRPDEIQFPRLTRRHYPSHGETVEDGRLGGHTTTDYFYFSCPACQWIMQAEPLKAIPVSEGKGLVLHIGLYCDQCQLHELVKLPAHTGWMGGYLNQMPLNDYTWERHAKESAPAPPEETPVRPRHKPLTPKQRFAVFLRYGCRCVYCGRTPTDGIKLEVDHIDAKANGGQNEDENYFPACRECNIGKGKLDIV